MVRNVTQKPRTTNRPRNWYRHHSKRMVRNRVRNFTALWQLSILLDVEEPPRSAEVLMKEFWHKRRVGQFKKWNGVCSCGICRDEKYNRERFKRNAMKEIQDALCDV